MTPSHAPNERTLDVTRSEEERRLRCGYVLATIFRRARETQRLGNVRRLLGRSEFPRFCLSRPEIGEREELLTARDRRW